MLRIAHISDTHLGNRQYGSDIRKQDYIDAFEECIDRCIELDIHTVIHTGDLFDDPNPDIDTLDETIRILEKLEEENIHFYGIVGNHERKRSGQWMDLIGRLGNTHRLSTEPTYIENSDGDSVTLYGFDAIRKNQWSTTDFSVTKPDEEHTKNPSIVCFHELFYPPLDKITADYNLKNVISEMNINPELIALGDNHNPEETTFENEGQDITGYYPGSTEKTSRNDPHEHSFTAIGIEDSEIKTRSKVPLENTRPFITATLSFEEGDGVDFAEDELNSTNFTTGPNTKNPVGVIKLQGENTGVTHNDIRRLVRDEPIEVLKIVDERVSSEFEFDEVDMSQDATDINTAIDEQIESIQISDDVTNIEEIVRETDNIPDSHVRDEVKGILNNTDDTDDVGNNNNNGDNQ